MTRTPDEAQVRAALADLRAEGRELRSVQPPFDEAAFRDRAMALAARSEDPELLDAVWDYREGKIDRVALRRHPAYVRHAVPELADLRDRLERSGVTEALRPS